MTAASASAATHHVTTTTATTNIKNRPDSGGGGNTWAIDRFSRQLVLNYEGRSIDPAMAATPYMYSAQLNDQGTFLDLPGQLTPNQGGHNLGKVLKPRQVAGTMKGNGYFGLFYSSTKAHSPRSYANLGVEISENDHGVVTGLNFHGSSTWPELAFPAGTVFSGVNEVQFRYQYDVPAWNTFRTVNGHRVTIHHPAQRWVDASYNNDGQVRSAGNITGR